MSEHEAKVQKFTETIKAWSAERLLGYYTVCANTNEFGSRDEELHVLHAELLSRMS